MQLVPNHMPPERLISSMEAQESAPSEESSDSPFVLRGAGVLSGNGRWMFIGLTVGAILMSISGVIFSRFARDDNGHIHWPKFIKARTYSIASAGSNAPPAPIIVQLGPEMVRVTAIALGHPRLAVVNGRALAEGDSVAVSKSNSPVALTLRVVKISDGRIDFSDGTNMFSARLTILTADQLKSK